MSDSSLQPTVTTVTPLFDTTALIPVAEGCARQKRCCCCKEPSCREITKLFRELKDQRGRFIQVPLSKAITRHVQRKQLVEKVRKRWEAHLPILETLPSFDRRSTIVQEQKHGRPLESSPETPTKKQARCLVFLAMHHFHPFLVSSSFSVDTKTQERKFSFQYKLDKTTIEANIPDHANNGYAEEDMFGDDKGVCYVPTPSYPNQSAKEDALTLKFRLEGRQRAAKEFRKRPRNHGTSAGGGASLLTSPDDVKRIKEDPEAAAKEILELRQAAAATFHELESVEQIKNSNVGPTEEEVMEKVASKTVEIMAGPGGGYNRLSLISDRWHAAHPEQAKVLYGIGNWEETLAFVEKHFGLVPPKPTMETLQGKLTEFDRCMIAKLYSERKVDMQTIGMYYAVGQSTISIHVGKWTPLWKAAAPHALKEEEPPSNSNQRFF